VLHSGVRSITDLMVLPGLINLDFADVRTVMTEMGKAMMGTGEATGEDRALMASQNAIANPLLDEVSLKGAKAVLVNVTGGLDMTLLEVDEAANAISDQVDPEANIIFGAAFDPSLDGKIRVSVVATGMDGQSIAAIEPKAPRGTVNNAAPLLIKDLPPPAPQAQPTATYARAPQAAAAQPQTPIYSRSTTPEAPRPSSQSASFGDPRRGAYEAPVAMTPPAQVQVSSYEPEDVEQGDLLGTPVEAPIMNRAAEEIETDDSPMFTDRHLADDHRQKRNGLLSLFGGGRPRHDPPPPPLRDFRNDPTPVLQARAAAQQAPQPAEEEHLDAAEDLEIPSFLRRLAN